MQAERESCKRWKGHDEHANGLCSSVIIENCDKYEYEDNKWCKNSLNLISSTLATQLTENLLNVELLQFSLSLDPSGSTNK